VSKKYAISKRNNFSGHVNAAFHGGYAMACHTTIDQAMNDTYDITINCIAFPSFVEHAEKITTKEHLLEYIKFLDVGPQFVEIITKGEISRLKGIIWDDYVQVEVDKRYKENADKNILLIGDSFNGFGCISGMSANIAMLDATTLGNAVVDKPESVKEMMIKRHHILGGALKAGLVIKKGPHWLGYYYPFKWMCNLQHMGFLYFFTFVVVAFYLSRLHELEEPVYPQLEKDAKKGKELP